MITWRKPSDEPKHGAIVVVLVAEVRARVMYEAVFMKTEDQPDPMWGTTVGAFTSNLIVAYAFAEEFCFDQVPV